MSAYNLLLHSITKHNLIDLLWENRPELELRKCVCLGLSECGEELSSKIERVRKQIRKAKCDSIILTLLDDIACNQFEYFLNFF